MEQVNQPKTPVSLSIVFSFFNEEEVLPQLISRTRKALKDEQQKGTVSNYELIFVNDRSTDNSVNVLMEQDKSKEDIRIINMSRNFGVSPCVLAGMKKASGDLVVYMDADLQDPPELISELIDAWKKGDNIDVVHTVRTKRRGEGKIKLLITKIGYRILHSISSLKIPIETGDFKLLTRRAIDHLISFKEKRPFIRGLVCWIGFNQARVFYVRPPRAAGKTKFSVFGLKVISNFLESALISFSSTPLQVSSIFAVFLIVTSIGFFIASFMFKANAVVLSIVAAIFFVGSIILFCLGIIGFYLTNIFEETKKRPNYIIDSTYGFKE